MPNLINSGGTGGSGASEIVIWDPSIEQFKLNDKFYGIRFYPANGSVIVNEILEIGMITHLNSNTAGDVSLPEYRVGDAVLDSDGKYNGSETFANASNNAAGSEYFDPYDHTVYKNWLTSQAELSFSWYTDNKRLIVEVA